MTDVPPLSNSTYYYHYPARRGPGRTAGPALATTGESMRPQGTLVRLRQPTAAAVGSMLREPQASAARAPPGHRRTPRALSRRRQSTHAVLGWSETSLPTSSGSGWWRTAGAARLPGARRRTETTQILACQCHKNHTSIPTCQCIAETPRLIVQEPASPMLLLVTLYS